MQKLSISVKIDAITYYRVLACATDFHPQEKKSTKYVFGSDKILFAFLDLDQ